MKHQVKSLTMLKSTIQNNLKKKYFNRCYHNTNYVKNHPKKVMYYEDPNNTMNPHTYFYRVLAVPFIKFCGIMMGTYYGMNGIWYLLEKENCEQEVRLD